MRIAVVSHYFWPEPGAPSARLLELGREWVGAGHAVTVVTNFPNHPTGVVPPEYTGRSFQEEEAFGLRIVRCRTYATPNQGFVRRTLGHLNFMFQARRQAWRTLQGTDVVVASSPTLFAAVAGLLLARRVGARFVIEVRDLWPAIFVELGVLRNRLAIRALEALELHLYGASAAVVTVTRAFARDIEARGIDVAKLHVIPNGVDLERFEPGPPDAALLGRLGLAGRFVALYCGAHGISHGLVRLIDVAEQLRGDERLHFLFVGEGAERERLVAEARRRSLDNVTFLGGVPREEVLALYRSADVCFVPLRDLPLFRTFIPSKMFEILACGRPILASLAGEAAEILEASGAALVVPPEDVEAIAGGLRRLVSDPALRAELGARGRPFVAQGYDRRRLAERYLEVLKGLR